MHFRKIYLLLRIFFSLLNNSLLTAVGGDASYWLVTSQDTEDEAAEVEGKWGDRDSSFMENHWSNVLLFYFNYLSSGIYNPNM